MFTGTPAQYADALKRSIELAEQIAELLNRLDAISPGSTGGLIRAMGVEITNHTGTWTVR